MPGGQVQVLDTGRNPGYPFFIAGKAGHRPPKPPLDTLHDGGLPRHIITGGVGNEPTLHVESRLSMDKQLVAVTAQAVPETGTAIEQVAMDFHSRRFHPTFLPDGTPVGDAVNPNAGFKTNGLPAIAGAPFADPCIDDAGLPAGVASRRQIQAAAFQLDMVMNKLGWHFPQSRILAHWQDVGDILNRVKPTEPFFFRANSGDCIEFFHTNLVPHVYEADDYQVRTPTDVIGQHIHLVKFDVTSSDGSGNGFNYEDGTFSPLEVQERIAAINAGQGGLNGQALVAQPHPFFQNLSFPGLDTLGAQTTIQRWYADPTVTNQGVDRTLGTVFTHDHFGPSTHQQAGLYAFLGVEPRGSSWRDPETGAPFGVREDGGPTSFRADIITGSDGSDSYREFFMFLADMQPAYAEGPLQPIEDPAHAAVFGEAVVGHGNHELAIRPAALEEAALPIVVEKAQVCPDGVNTPPCPEAIMAADEGTMLVNYRNEPVAHRIANAALNGQAVGRAGDLGFVYRSDVTREIPELNAQPNFFTNPLTLGVSPGDPFTPLLRVNQGDKVTIRLGVGAHEESHNATFHGLRWLLNPASPNSGYRNHQHLGIAEHFELKAPIVPAEHTGAEPVDHLYKLGAATDSQWNGAWGLIRAYNRDGSDELLPLPNNLPRPVAISNANEFDGVCPTRVRGRGRSRVRSYDVTAVTAADALPLASLSGINLALNPELGRDMGTLIYNSRAGNPASLVLGPLSDPGAILYVRTSDLDDNGKLLPGVPVEPLILRAAAGECIEVTLRNRLPADPVDLVDQAGFSHFPPIVDGFNANQVKTSKEVGLHPQLVAYDLSLADGTNVGGNRGADGVANKQTAGPGESITYRWYAGILTQGEDNRLTATPVEFGATGLIPADPMKQAGKGLVGALIIEPPRARWREDRGSRASARVNAPGVRPFREHVIVMQDSVNLVDAAGTIVPSAVIEEDAEDSGKEGFNYRVEPFWFRLGFAPGSTPEQGNSVDFKNVFSNALTGEDPQTPVFTARRRTPTRFRVVMPGGHMRNQVFVLHGHSWERLPYVNNSTRL
ncbi:MAG: copper oxidase, partial [Candidatus Eisenbacteria bacterium]|nr:copper oxidase [Candidatus Eisenbacteria bacterium]